MPTAPPTDDASAPPRGLDALNFFLADVRDGIGPYLGVYLLATHAWEPGAIGVAMAAAGFSGVAAQWLAGAWIDRTPRKIAWLAWAIVAIAVSGLVMVWWPNTPVVIAAQVLTGAAGALVAPALAGITLGLSGPRLFAARIGRNEGCNHAGNVLAALLSAGVGHWVSMAGVFYLNALLAVASLWALARIPGSRIDHRLARGLDADADAPPARWRELLALPGVLAFMVGSLLFHMANAPMLLLAVQKAASLRPDWAALLTPACILVAQLVMVPVSLWAPRGALRWGLQPLLVLGCAVLPLRGLLYTQTQSPWAIVAVQLLDGIGAALYGVLSVALLAELARGSGRFNALLGIAGTAVGLGASLSVAVSGWIAQAWGYNAAFSTLAATGLLATIVWWWLLPATPGHAVVEAAA